MRSNLLMLVAVAAVAAAAFIALRVVPEPAPQPDEVAPGPAASVRMVSPRLMSNDTAQPLLVFGAGFRKGDQLHVEGVEKPLDTVLIDEGHMTAVLPAGLSIPAHRTFRRLRVGLVRSPDDPGARVDLVNDVDYPLPYALEASPDGGRVFVASPTTDEVLVTELAGGEVASIAVGDGPRTLARWGELLVVGHRHEATLHVLSMAHPETKARVIKIPAPAERIVVEGGSVFFTSSLTDRVYEVDLETGVTRRSDKAGINPQAVAASDGLLAVGQRSSGDVRLLPTGAPAVDVAPDTTVEILGGRTPTFAPYVMGGAYPRALVIERGGARVFVASVGPNVGPNPKKMEVSMNGGVGVIDVRSRRFVRHVSLGEGIPQALAYDADRALLFAADVSRGRVVALTARATPKVLGAASLPPLAGGPATPAPVVVPFSAGPWDLRLVRGGEALLVLERLTGRVTEVDVRAAAKGELSVVRSVTVTDLGRQGQRRLGEVLYFTDVGRTGMSCDGCHPDGHDGGILFTKGDPMHIYRAPTVRSARESAPYFTPALFPSLEYTAQRVLGRNRFHKPDPTPVEVRALGLYQAAITAPPSPYRSRLTGAMPTRVDLPNGRLGAPRAGLGLFMGKAKCAGCHPPPQFTTDQDKATRAKLYDVGTAVALPLRPDLQVDDPYPLPAPALVGIWDQWPLLHGGQAGYTVQGDAARPTHPFALARVFELDTAGRHGAWASLTERERWDLLAFLLML